MRAITSTTRATLEALQAKLNTILGYPIAGVDVGNGVHVPPEQSVTLRAVDIEKHPLRKEWMLPVDSYDAAMFDAASKAALQSATLVNEKDWKPAEVTLL